ncbi:TadE/TadG family type IV pilus assembly protein [Pontixanthobacter aestiaquae]|uniref:Pilus assembly protein n=1 Tax=Pontixanthobacter aestiaquae TaxID=1509367 RepID=A0A844Z9G0_9SPHN|nr:TadE/TadG family type IV pilus assembly protein [Pontixanthobacter aestiaquae]MDN3645366.1 TadE/TadG family type IV pilus assembly protein [Pontixanthobacter aestiaquae]MXO83633.1 pilus assembly protein [Pontixanthobacter aestiaquae]
MITMVVDKLRRNQEGVSVVEFAMIAPVLCMMMLGMFDMAYNMYANQMLHGAVQEAARDSTLEGATEASLDASVTNAVNDVVGGATMTFNRKAYASFSAVAQEEDYTDINNDGTCNDGEPFEDANRNGIWDSDQGEAGNGGARDAILYEVSIRYARAFPIAPFIGISPFHETTATTVLRNQPFDGAIDRTTTGNCV